MYWVLALLMKKQSTDIAEFKEKTIMIKNRSEFVEYVCLLQLKKLDADICEDL